MLNLIQRITQNNSKCTYSISCNSTKKKFNEKMPGDVLVLGKVYKHLGHLVKTVNRLLKNKYHGIIGEQCIIKVVQMDAFSIPYFQNSMLSQQFHTDMYWERHWYRPSVCFFALVCREQLVLIPWESQGAERERLYKAANWFYDRWK